MIPYLRKEKILELLHIKDVVTIEEITEHIKDASVSTLRRDLKSLEKEEKIVTLAGGAVKLRTNSSDIPVSKKAAMNKTEKQVITEIAAKLINDGETIYLDSGTTCSQLLSIVCKKRITIITSNTDVLLSLHDLTAEIIFLGGHFSHTLSSVNGPVTEDNIARFNFDKAFLGANGIDAVRGVTTPRVEEASKKIKVINQSKEVYLLVDSSKFGKVLMSKAFDLNQCTVISDKYDENIGEITKIIVPK